MRTETTISAIRLEKKPEEYIFLKRQFTVHIEVLIGVWKHDFTYPPPLPPLGVIVLT